MNYFMDPFSPTPPDWTDSAIHARGFFCPSCQALPSVAQGVWINRRAPVSGEEGRRKWQEFYQCECGQSWWAWSSDRPPSQFNQPPK